MRLQLFSGKVGRAVQMPVLVITPLRSLCYLPLSAGNLPAQRCIHPRTDNWNRWVGILTTSHNRRSAIIVLEKAKVKIEKIVKRPLY